MAQQLETLTDLAEDLGLRAECDSMSKECDILSLSSEGSKHTQYTYVHVDRIHS